MIEPVHQRKSSDYAAWSRLYRIVTALLGLALGLNLSAGATEIVYPVGTKLQVEYVYSDTTISTRDTLSITRSLVNRDDFGLKRLYLSDWIPRNFRLVNYSATHNGQNISSSLATDNRGLLGSDLTGYFWEFSGSGSAVDPGDSVSLKVQFICVRSGSYTFPLHATVCHAPGKGSYFASAPAQRIQVAASEDGLPSAYLVSEAYPNPFNATVSIRYTGSDLVGERLEFEVFNSLGQIIDAISLLPAENTGTFNWSPEPGAGSGAYFYRLTSGRQVSTGKTLLVK